MSVKTLVHLVLTAGVIPLFAFGWGTGHDTVARAVAARLPEPWHTRLQGEALKAFCTDSHYPDSFEPFPEERVGEGALAYLKSHGITKRFDLHSDKGRAVAFCLLARAIKEGTPDRVLLWVSALSHSTADMVACNHDPVVHIATYGWCQKDWALRLSGGKPYRELMPCLDLGWLESEAWTKNLFDRRLDTSAPLESGATAAETLHEVLLYGARGVDACAPHGPAILEAAAGWTDTRDRAMGERLADHLSALGAWAVERVLRDFSAAQRLAQAGSIPDVTAEVLARYEAAVDAFMEERLLSSDAFAQSALNSVVEGTDQFKVLIEPCWRMHEGMFGFGDRVLAVQIVNTLRRQGKKAELIDVRDFLKGSVNLEKVTALIVPAQQCVSYRILKKETLAARLGVYRQSGGRTVWIGGGEPPGILFNAQPRPWLIKGEAKGWPVPLADFVSGTLQVTGLPARKLARHPEYDTGWHWPRNPYVFAPEAVGHVQVLATWRGTGAEKVVGAAWPKERPDVAYLPAYAVSPYIWTREAPCLGPVRLELDAAGTEALAVAIGALKKK